MWRQTGHKEVALEVSKDRRVLQSTMYGPLREHYARGINSIVQQLSTDVVEESAAKRAVRTVLDIVKRIPGLTVSGHHKGGSYGRRTMVPDHFDVDTIVYVKAFNNRALRYPDDWQDDKLMLAMRKQVARHLRANTGWNITIPEDAHYRYVLQLQVEGVEVDLLLVPDCLEGRAQVSIREQHDLLMSPVYAAPEASTYVQLRERADSAALTESLKAQNDDVKGVVRLIKAWYKLGVCGGLEPESRIGSIALEVLVLAAAERLAEKMQGSEEETGRSSRGRRKKLEVRGNTVKLDLFVETLRLIIEAVPNKPTRGSVVMVDAGEWGYAREVGMRCAHNWSWNEVKVIHPIDPTCNLARARWHRAPSDWQGLAREARELLTVMEDTARTWEHLLEHTTLGRALSLATLPRWDRLITPVRDWVERFKQERGNGNKQAG